MEGDSSRSHNPGVARNVEPRPRETLGLGQERPRLANRWTIGAVALSVLLSIGFFVDGLHANLASLSSDQYNILAVCAKLDHPDLLAQDMVVGDVSRVRYYTPLFVSLVRILSLPDHNYIRGLNILLLLTSIVYTLGWWALFSRWSSGWVPIVLAFLARGIMWPPGNELWGIAGVWTMLPRTLFTALIPWVLWAWFNGEHRRRAWVAGCLSCGLLVNIHPVSGVCWVVALACGEFIRTLLTTERLQDAASRTALCLALSSIGMVPYAWAYVGGLGSARGITHLEFDQALRMRISDVFLNPVAYLRRWVQPKWIALLFLPWVAYLPIRRRLRAGVRRDVACLGGFLLACALVSLLPFALETALRSLGYHPRFAFQLVRNGKYVLVPALTIAAILAGAAADSLNQRVKRGNTVVAVVSLSIFALTFVSVRPAFDRMPWLGDDVSRSLWPECLTHHRLWGDGQDMGRVLSWIRQNTRANETFVGPCQIRVGALRSVIHDGKGAGMLIEGDPKAFVLWAKREEALERAGGKSSLSAAVLMAGWGADYWVTRTPALPLRQVFADSGWFVYDLRKLRRQGIQLAGNPSVRVRLPVERVAQNVVRRKD